MSQELLDDLLDDLLPLPAAAKLLPKNSSGKSPSIQTLRRWAKRGSRNVFLELTFVGGRAYASRQALLDFVARRNATAARVVNTSLATGSSRAAAKLKRMGA
jgi:hypothetical protein